MKLVKAIILRISIFVFFSLGLIISTHLFSAPTKVYAANTYTIDSYNLRIGGISATDLFGLDYRTIVDLNNDGARELIEEKSIYYGGSSMDSSPDLTFPYNVHSAGDVNGDGFVDFIAGDYANDVVYIYFGGSTIDYTADVIFNGEASGDRFGFEFASAGDVNNDGYNDVLIGAYLNDEAGGDAGRAYIFYGSASMSSKDLSGSDTADVTFTGEAGGDMFGGRDTIKAGDVNNDGYGDVIIGAYQNDAGGNNAGRAYIFYGSASMSSKDLSGSDTADVTLTGEAEENLGWHSCFAGDINGDGYDDVLTGGDQYYVGALNVGRVAYFYGGSPMDSTADINLLGVEAVDTVGWGAYYAGDFNGDGRPDLSAAAPYKTVNGFAFSGAVYIIYNFPHDFDITPPFSTTNNSDSFSLTSSLSASESLANISGVEYSIDNLDFGGSWFTCNADDNVFDSTSESFQCSDIDLSSLAEGKHTAYFRAYDENMAYSIASDYGLFDFTIDKTNPSDFNLIVP